MIFKNNDKDKLKKVEIINLLCFMVADILLLCLIIFIFCFYDKSDMMYVFEDTTYILDDLHKDEKVIYIPEKDRIYVLLQDEENCLVKRSFDNVKIYIIKDKSKPKIHILQQKQLSTLEKFLLKKYGKAPDRYIFASIITKLYVKSLDDVLCVRSIDDVRSALY
jgi:hypothetical protein